MHAMTHNTAADAPVDYRTDPSRYRHWRLSVDGPVATLAMDVSEDGGIRDGYKLKLNSYDLGVDIELHDAVQRIRFEHPAVRTVVLTSAKDRVFCSGANIFMLGLSTHPWKVNFCKFTNETRNGLEDSSRNSGLKFVAAVNGVCAGGGYELALACDEIVLVDDRSSAVSLPEVPLLGVLPGTGGLTRLTDKRHVRHDLADIFCTTSEGVRGDRAKEWRLVDHVAKAAQFRDVVQTRARELGRASDRPAEASGVTLPRVERADDAAGYHYAFVDVTIDRDRRLATVTVRAPAQAPPSDVAGIEAAAASWWPLQMARELDDAILMLRTNELDVGTWLLRTEGDSGHVLAVDRTLADFGNHWFVRETLALAADRSYMAALPDEPAREPQIVVSALNDGAYPMVNGCSRLAQRFYGESAPLTAVRNAIDKALGPAEAIQLGLVTATPDDIDWGDEIRIALEERASLSPDALTGLEANLRFGERETMETRIFGRLSAWQNWIFIRPNAVGESGALKVYGKGERAQFDFKRV